jgi:ABC-type sulfate transport system substrate-binding protein
MRKVPYLQWEDVFLDTTIIFAYIQATRDNNADDVCRFVKRLIDDLNSNKSTSGAKRRFYISAISISEMYDRSSDQKKTEKIIKKMNIRTMTFVPFDTDIAEHMTSVVSNR